LKAPPSKVHLKNAKEVFRRHGWQKMQQLFATQKKAESLKKASPGQAESLYLELIEKAPNHFEFNKNLANLYYWQLGKDCAKALRYYKKAVELNPGYSKGQEMYKYCRKKVRR